jgi:hypothetical protein
LALEGTQTGNTDQTEVYMSSSSNYILSKKISIKCIFYENFIVNMFPPHLMGRQEKKKELIPEHLKMPLRIVGFALTVFAIIKFGEQLDMPEPTRL